MIQLLVERTRNFVVMAVGIAITIRVNKDQKNLIRNINNRLRKNWRILESLNPHQKTKSTRDKLIAKGLILIISQVFIQQSLAQFIILCTTKGICP